MGKSPERVEPQRLTALRASLEGRAEAARSGVCLDCGEIWPRLYTHVLKHGGLQEYLKRWKYPPNTKVMSDEFLGRMRRQGRKIWSRIPKEKQEKIRSHLRTRRGKPRAESFTQTGPGKTWDIVQLRTDGYTYQDIEEKIGTNWRTVHHRCQSLGFPSGRRLQFDWGQPFSWGDQRKLRKASGLTADEFAAQVGVLPVQLGRHPESQHVDAALAKKVIGWREIRVRALLSRPLGRRRLEGYRVDSAIETFYPGLRRQYRLLVETSPELRIFLNENAAATIRELADHLAAKAQEETASRSTRRPFRDLLLWLPQVAPSLERQFDEIRGSTQVRDLALSVIASHLQITSSAVDYIVKNRAPVIPPRQMRSLLLGAEAPASKPAKRGGRPRVAAEKSVTRLIGAAVQQALPRMQKGMVALAGLKKDNPLTTGSWKSGLLGVGFSEGEAEALLTSRTASAAAQKFVATAKNVNLKTVRNACSLHRPMNAPQL